MSVSRFVDIQPPMTVRLPVISQCSLLVLALTAGCANRAVGLTATQDPMVIAGEESFLDGYSARAGRGRIHVVVEIPTGTNAKWEVDKKDGVLRWQIEDGRPRVVKYLGYPANYGMVPRTLLPKELGGDGDPLDVLLLGPAVTRGSVVSAQLVGVLKLLDGGEQDDKLIAVAEGVPFAGVASIADLDAKFAGVTEILRIWMTNYKGPGRMESQGFADAAAAEKILAASILAFDQRR